MQHMQGGGKRVKNWGRHDREGNCGGSQGQMFGQEVHMEGKSIDIIKGLNKDF